MFFLWCRPNSRNASDSVLQLWDPEMTMCLKGAVLQPAHCFLAKLPLLPLHLPQCHPYCVCSWLKVARTCYTCAVKLHRRAIIGRDITWHICSPISAVSVLTRADLPMKEFWRLKMIRRSDTLLHMYFWSCWTEEPRNISKAWVYVPGWIITTCQDKIHV